jgi:hypothetical protein
VGACLALWLTAAPYTLLTDIVIEDISRPGIILPGFALPLSFSLYALLPLSCRGSALLAVYLPAWRFNFHCL